MSRSRSSVWLFVAVAIVAVAIPAAAAPALTSISPTSGYPGTQVTFTGTGFGASQGTGSVWLGSKLAGSIVSWLNTQVVAVGPAGAATGSAQVQQGGVWSNAIAFTVIKPNITSISPTSAYPGNQVTINGTNFGTAQGSGSVWLGNKLAGSIVSWSDTQIVAVVAATALSGSAQVQQNGVWGNSVTFTVIQPNITSISPSTGYPGTQVTFTGTNFGATQGSGSVWLGNKLAGSIVSWSNTQIVAVVAATALSGSAQVQQGGLWSNSIAFTVIQPNITSITPTGGVAGTQVTFTGTNFGATQGSGSVWLGSKLAGSIVSWSNTQIVATVASGSITGSAQIQQAGVWSNAIAFTVATPTLTSISTDVVRAGDPITLTGTNFGATQGSGSVWLGSKLAAGIVSWSSTEIVATVASGAETGNAIVQQGGVWSNSIELNVITPYVQGVSPFAGSVGYPATIQGSGFGETQGSGLVWLGTKYAASIVSWSDEEIVAIVAAGSETGNAQVYQNGVWSNEATFLVGPRAVLDSIQVQDQVRYPQDSYGSVFLTEPAPPGIYVNVSSSNPSLLAIIPASVDVQEGSTEGYFTMYPQAQVTELTEVVITAELNGHEETVTVYLLPPGVSQVEINPHTARSGDDVVVTVELSGPALEGQTIVFTSTDDDTLPPPPPIVLEEGQTSAEATITLGPVYDDVLTAILTATIEPSEGESATVDITPLGPTLDSVAVDPTSVIGSNPATFTVTLTEPAPAGGLEVDLYHTSNVSMQPFVIVPEGETSATVPLGTDLEPGPGSTSSTPLAGHHKGTGRVVWLQIHSPAGNFVESMALAESRTAGGNLVTVTITLHEAAGEDGAVIALESDNVAVASVPATVTVPEGDTTVTFDINTDAVLSPVDVFIRAAYEDVITRERLTVVPTPSTISLVSLEFEWSTVVGGDDATATVTLSDVAPSGGVVITLGGSRAGLATVPASVTVPAGETSASFTVTTQHWDRIRYALVTATYDGLVRSAELKMIAGIE
jgi:hypothetical protein